MENPEDEKSISDILSESYDAIEAGEELDVPKAEKLEFEQDEDLAPEENTDAAEEPAENDGAKEEESEVVEEESDKEPDEPAPSSWKREIAEKWKDLPVEVKNEINRRESDYHRGIEQYKQYAGIGRDIEKVIQPHMDTIQQLGVHPMEAVGALLNADRQLRTGSAEQKAQLLGQLAQEYGVDLAQVKPPAPVDPAVMQLRQQNAHLQRFQRSVIEQQNAHAQSEIERFSADPKNVHFQAVKEEMSLLLQSGKAQSLQEAYDMASWMRPDIRKSLVEQQRTEAEKKAASQARNNRAKSAAVGIKGSASSTGGSLKPDASLRDTISAALDGDI